jgi:hypothetical protein
MTPSAKDLAPSTPEMATVTPQAEMCIQSDSKYKLFFFLQGKQWKQFKVKHSTTM